MICSFIYDGFKHAVEKLLVEKVDKTAPVFCVDLIIKSC